MKDRRDYVEEISEVRDRLRFGSALAELGSRRKELKSAFKNRDPGGGETIRYFPVAMVACIESFFRMAVRDLINAGEPYLSNAEDLVSGVKLDFRLVRTLHGKAISVGEFVSHTLPLSQMSYVQKALSKICGKDFLHELRSTTDRWAREVQGKPECPILADADRIYADVARMFKLRHIVCHEIASRYQITSEEVERCFESCDLFLTASSWFISETLEPGAPLQQIDINRAAAMREAECDQELEALCNQVRQRIDSERLAAFEDTQKKWTAFRNAWSQFLADDYLGGSVAPWVGSRAAIATTKQRIALVSDYLRGRESPTIDLSKHI